MGSVVHMDLVELRFDNRCSIEKSQFISLTFVAALGSDDPILAKTDVFVLGHWNADTIQSTWFSGAWRRFRLCR